MASFLIIMQSHSLPEPQYRDFIGSHELLLSDHCDIVSSETVESTCVEVVILVWHQFMKHLQA